MPNARARAAISPPMRPSPTMPSVRPRSSVPSERAAIPAPVAHRREGVGQMAHERDERSEKQLGDGDGVAGRRVDDGDAEGGGLGDVDVVGADAGAADDLEAARAAEQLGGDLRGAASDDGVVVADDVEEVAPRRGGALVDVEARLRAQELDAVGIDFVGDQDIEGAHGAGGGDSGAIACERNVLSNRGRFANIFRRCICISDLQIATVHRFVHHFARFR